jgi:hypothetical protein
MRYASIFFQLYEVDSAINYYHKAVSIIYNNADMFPLGSYHQSNLSAIFLDLTSAYITKNDFQNAKENLIKSEKSLENMISKDTPVYLKIQLAGLNDGFAGFYQKTAQYDKAEFYLDRAYSIWREINIEDSVDRTKFEAIYYNNSGLNYSNWHKYDKARIALLKSYSLNKKLYTLQPTKFANQYLNSILSLSGFYNLIGDTTESQAILEVGLKIAKKEEEKNRILYGPILSSIYQNLGVSYGQQGILSKARNSYLLALSSYETLLEEHPGMFEALTAQTLFNIANVAFAMDSVKEAYNSAQRSQKLYESLDSLNQKINSPFSVHTYNLLGKIYIERNQFDSAEYFLNKALTYTLNFISVKENSKIYTEVSTNLLEIYLFSMAESKGRSLSYRKENKFNEVMPVLFKVAKIDSFIYFNLVDYFLMGSWYDLIYCRLEECEAKIEMLISLDEGMEELHCRVGHLMVAKGEMNLAMKIYKSYKGDKESLKQEILELIKLNVHPDFSKVLQLLDK